MRLGFVRISLALVILLQSLCFGQMPQASGAPILPLTSQIKKTVVFLSTLCLHDFTSEIGALKQQVSQMPVQQQLAALQQLNAMTSRFRLVPQSFDRLTPDESCA
jgi:hypothetical protein